MWAVILMTIMGGAAVAIGVAHMIAMARLPQHAREIERWTGRYSDRLQAALVWLVAGIILVLTTVPWWLA